MSCKIRRNRHGFLAYRVYWRGVEFHEGTGLRDTPQNREKVTRRAEVISEEIRAGTFEYLQWFRDGNQAHLFRPAPPAPVIVPQTIAQWRETVCLPRKVPPLVRISLADTYRKHLRNHILPVFGRRCFSDVTVGALEDFRALRITRDGPGKGLSPKTARDIIDGTLRALYRDARKEGLATGDPFVDLVWPRRVIYEPDPFSEAERDTLLDYFWRKDQPSYPLVYTLFHTGVRTGEAVGLRQGALDLRAGTLTVRTSRSRGEDNPPKTKNSQRTLTLRPDVVAILRAAQPLHVTPDTFVFTTPTGLPLDTDRFVESRWHRALRATGIRPRKFYATRHTFISVALSRGCRAKWVAKYCGTSLEMLDRHYGRWMGDDRTARAACRGFAAYVGRVRTPRWRAAHRNLSRNLTHRRRKYAIQQAEGGRFELPRTFALAVFKTAALNLARPPLR